MNVNVTICRCELKFFDQLKVRLEKMMQNRNLVDVDYDEAKQIIQVHVIGTARPQIQCVVLDKYGKQRGHFVAFLYEKDEMEKFGTDIA